MQTQGSNTTGNGATNESSQTQSGEDKSDLMEEARKAARDRAFSEADHQRQTASQTVRDSAKALEQASESLDKQGQRTLAQTTSSIASGLSGLAQKLEQSNTDELVQEVTRLARQNPTLFILGGVGAGLALSRFLKASSGPSGGQHH